MTTTPIPDAVLEATGDGETVDVDVDSETVYTDHVAEVREALHERHASRLSETFSDPSAFDSAAAAATADGYAKEGASSAAFASTYAPVLDELVDAAFDLVRAGRVDEAESALRSGLQTACADMTAGLEQYDEVAEQDADEYADAVLTIEEVLESIPFPIYMLDADDRVIGWNYGHTALVGMSREEAIGKTAKESVVKATYSEGARKLTLAEKVTDAPRTAHQEYDVERDDTPYYDGPVYYDSSTSSNLNDETVEIEFWAAPIFDDDGDLIAVFEILNDRTEEVRRQEALTELVGEITETLHGITEGELASRAAFTDDEYVDEELLLIVDEVNQMASEFQSLVGDVDEKAEALAESIEESADVADRVDDRLEDQNQALEQVTEGMMDFSATMEEMASTSSEVASAATEARSEVDTGVDSAREARDAADEVRESSDELVDTVSALADHISEVEEVAEVISEIADQTNLLALNANIEAARAGDAGSGFNVVANEVKSLADETQSHTEEIETHIERIKSQSQQTVEAVEQSHEQVSSVDDRIESTVQAFEEIADAVERAAAGIEDVSEANDDQATRVEEVLSMAETAQEEADRVTEAAEEIVEETEVQQTAVRDLESKVDELTEG
ncbi:methyl-accepting chemotaxis protein [Natrialbaceae archaeon A-arb3/5]